MRISNHALERYRERVNKNVTRWHILKVLEKAKEVTYKEVRSACGKRYRPSKDDVRYLRFTSIIFVVRQRLVVTILPAQTSCLLVKMVKREMCKQLHDANQRKIQVSD